MENPENGNTHQNKAVVMIIHDNETGALEVKSLSTPAVVMGVLRDALMTLEENRRHAIRESIVMNNNRPRIVTPKLA